MAKLTVRKWTIPPGGKNFPFRLCAVTKWGSSGAGNGQFQQPTGVAVDGSGNVYVADSGNKRIQKFDNNGNYVTQWGSYGSGNGQFFYPCAVAVGGTGNVYVADTVNNRIQKFDSAGAYLAQWGSNGSGDGQFAQPDGVAVDGAGNVYVADTDNNRIQKFDSAGRYVAKWPSPGRMGENMPNLTGPRGVAVDAAGNNYVADTMNYRVQRFDANGVYLGQWRRYGRDASRFHHPYSMAVDTAGNVYVADGNRDRIEKFNANGEHLERWCVKGSGPGNATPLGVAVDGSGNVFVADSANNCVVKFSPGSSFTLDEGRSEEFLTLAAGTYYVGELTIDRWTVSEIASGGSGSGGSGVVWGDGVHITLGADDVFCAFTNSDTIAPTLSIWSGLSTTSANPINFTVVFSEPVTDFATGAVTVSSTAGATTAVVTETAPNDGTTYAVAVSGMTGPGTVTVAVAAGVAKDKAGNSNVAATPATVTYDPGPTVTINRAAGQANPTNQSPINFTAVFSQPVTGFVPGLVRLAGTAFPTTTEVTEIAPKNGTTYNVAVSVRESDGTVSASLDAGSVRNAAGIGNQASPWTDNSVAYYGPLKVRALQPRRPSPASGGSIDFLLQFNKPGIVLGPGAVTLGGTAGATTPVVTQPSPDDSRTYNITVSGMTRDGMVIVTLDAGVVQDAGGNLNAAATSPAVNYLTPLTVTINKAPGRADPTR